MLTVNIPVYNIEVVDLVKQLHRQALQLEYVFEIRVYDDGSDEIFKSINRIVKGMPHVVYKEMESNLGRAAIRNKMAEESAFQWLLFLDADSKVVNENFIKRYFSDMNPGNIICGGRCYSVQKPDNPEKFLHWKYGFKRESISANKRRKRRGFFFMSNNFVLEKAIFENVTFRSEIKEYGHEDTLFGFDLTRYGYKIIHIENPIQHTGLENAAAFLRKSRLALGNLKIIEETILQEKKEFRRSVHFLNRYYQISAFLPNRFLSKLFNRYRFKMETNLFGTNPRLFLFDFYKLGYYASIKNR